MPMIVACTNLLQAVILLVFALNLFREGVAGGSPTGGAVEEERVRSVQLGWNGHVAGVQGSLQTHVNRLYVPFHMLPTLLHCEFCYTPARVLGIEATRLWE